MIRVFETFSGIGAQTKALKNIGIEHQVVGVSEWDINAIISYSEVHCQEALSKVKTPSKMEAIEYLEKFSFSSDGKKPIVKISKLKEKKLFQLYKAQKAINNLGSITQIKAENIPDFDLLTYSFPCQAISLQGKQEGLEKGTGTSSSLLWEIERILLELKKDNRLPKYLLMENVANLFSKKFIDFYNNWEQFLTSLGYKTEKKILKASFFNCPQNRERAFAVSILSSNDDENYVFPNGNFTSLTIEDILEENVSEKYFLPKLEEKIKHKSAPKKNTGIRSTVLENYTTFNSENIVYFYDSIAPTITANGAQSRIKIIDKNKKLRYLTPLEHWKLMGFQKEDFLNAKERGVISDNILKKQAGNSICVKVLEEIFKSLFIKESKSES